MNFLNSREQKQGAEGFVIILGLAWPAIVVWSIVNAHADELWLFLVPVSAYWLYLTVNSLREWRGGTDRHGTNPLSPGWWKRQAVELVRSLAIAGVVVGFGWAGFAFLTRLL